MSFPAVSPALLSALRDAPDRVMVFPALRERFLAETSASVYFLSWMAAAESLKVTATCFSRDRASMEISFPASMARVSPAVRLPLLFWMESLAERVMSNLAND